MAILFVWYPKGQNVGHATLALDGGAYVSWWPGGPVRGKVSTRGATAMGISGDRKAEGSAPDYASPPLTALDEGAMAAHWSKLSGRLPGREPHAIAQKPRDIPNGNYDLFSKSCAGVVLDVLIAGGMFAKYPVTASMVARNPFITPLLLKDLAEAMAGETGNKIIAILLNSDARAATLRRLWQYAN